MFLRLRDVDISLCFTAAAAAAAGDGAVTTVRAWSVRAERS